MADVNSNYPPVPDKDSFKNSHQELDSPAFKAYPITPTNAENLPHTTRGLYVGGAGNVFCSMAGGNTSHSTANGFFYNVVAGTILPIRTDGVYVWNQVENDTSQNTNASFLVGLY